MSKAAADSVFSNRMLTVLILLGFLSFAGATVFSYLGENPARFEPAGANSYSVSAIGHKGLYQTLERMGYPVQRSQRSPAQQTGYGGMLVLAEPDYQNETLKERAEEVREGLAGRTLLILPKWNAYRLAPLNRKWIGSPILHFPATLNSILDEFMEDGAVIQTEGPARFDLNKPNITPNLQNAQLIKHNDLLNPIIANDEGVLLGWIRNNGQTIHVLSDPDIIANHNLDSGQNALLAAHIIDVVRTGQGPIVFDETIHGLEIHEDLWKTLFEFPFVICTIIAFAAMIALGWSALGRFGRPLPEKPPLEPGKAGLIGNMTDMLEFGGHTSAILGQYRQQTRREVSQLLNAPSFANEAEFGRWIEPLENIRQTGISWSDITHEFNKLQTGKSSGKSVSEQDAVRLAGLLHRWKTEMLNGS